MAISEAQLETWGKQGPTAQFTATYETLRGVLNDSLSPYYPKSFEIFLQGSYKNTTNVYGDSDVDVVIRLDSIFYTDLYFLIEEEKQRYNRATRGRQLHPRRVQDFSRCMADKEIWQRREAGQ